MSLVVEGRCTSEERWHKVGEVERAERVRMCSAGRWEPLHQCSASPQTTAVPKQVAVAVAEEEGTCIQQVIAER